jgi:hypothetical protein
MPFPVDAAYVRATQAKLGVTFPLGFVSCMTKANGGELQADGETWWLHPFFDPSDRIRLKRTCNDIVRETAKAKEWPSFPKDAVAIAHNGAADQLLFLPSAEQPNQLQDAVFMWDHESGVVAQVADDFLDLT